ncbi:hypothetical protein IAQ61_005392 [Plenodomus lingam]|uniref:uncharacterized protein n=1 Tax=Leptosphaeria maculans TaxID=5022 RepID=UPI0033200A13|nr:hypothetical protein IAQ61_005392 [Plenodomus lingam]
MLPTEPTNRVSVPRFNPGSIQVQSTGEVARRPVSGRIVASQSSCLCSLTIHQSYYHPPSIHHPSTIHPPTPPLPPSPPSPPSSYPHSHSNIILSRTTSSTSTTTTTTTRPSSTPPPPSPSSHPSPSPSPVRWLPGSLALAHVLLHPVLVDEYPSRSTPLPLKWNWADEAKQTPAPPPPPPPTLCVLGCVDN